MGIPIMRLGILDGRNAANSCLQLGWKWSFVRRAARTWLHCEGLKVGKPMPAAPYRRKVSKAKLSWPQLQSSAFLPALGWLGWAKELTGRAHSFPLICFAIDQGSWVDPRPITTTLGVGPFFKDLCRPPARSRVSVSATSSRIHHVQPIRAGFATTSCHEQRH
jgi:hypothetical protein